MSVISGLCVVLWMQCGNTYNVRDKSKVEMAECRAYMCCERISFHCNQIQTSARQRDMERDFSERLAKSAEVRHNVIVATNPKVC